MIEKQINVDVRGVMAKSCGIAIGFMGILVIIGWMTGMESLKTIVPGLASMKANTAICFVLAGAGLLASQQRRLRLACGGLIGAIALVSLGEDFFGWQAGIDQFLFHDFGDSHALHPGRMSQMTALCFAAVSLSLILHDTCSRWGRRLTIALTLFIGAVGLLALIGYAYNVHALYGVAGFSSVALHTATAFLVLGLGLLAAREDGPAALVASEGPGGQLARRFFPAAVLVPPILVWLKLLGVQAGWFPAEFGPAFVVYACFVIFTALIWTICRQLDDLERKRRKAAEYLRRNEQRLSFVLQAVQIGTWEVDTQDYTANHTLIHDRIFGYETLVPHWKYEMFLEHVLPEDRPNVDRSFREATAAQSDMSFECRIRRADGEIRWIWVAGAHVQNTEGRAVGMSGVVMDITKRKQEQETLKRAKETAENANNAKEQFIAVLSHELRTPLTPVLVTVTAMEDQADLPAEIRTKIELIHRNVQMEVTMIDDLLDVTRINTGKIEIFPKVVDSQVCLQAALDFSQSEIEAKHLKLSMSPLPKNHHVLADPTRLQQVFWNLLRNAVKFTPEGGRISICSTNDNGHLKIEIADTGIGIPPEVLPRIFNVFEQGEKTTTRLFGGLGLGLSIAKAIVDLHHGTLTVVSEGKNKGTVFTVELPTVPTVPTVPEPPTPPSTSASRSELPAKILLVDDHADTLQTLTDLLLRRGIRLEPPHVSGMLWTWRQRNHFPCSSAIWACPTAAGWTSCGA